MFLQPSEVGFLKHLKEARVPLVEFEVPSKKILNVQSQLEKLIGQNYYLNKASVSVLGCWPANMTQVCQRWIQILFTSICLA